MDLPKNMQKIKNMGLVLSSNDAKPRLKWSLELHRRFVDAVSQLGGADKATPKSLKRVMGIPGLTLYHLKSHLQKYRLGKSQQTEFCINDEEIYEENQRSQSSGELGDGNQNQIDENFKIAQALQLQMEVQRKLCEQIEVQRHLQLRIEAQGKYLQSVLRKAEETLARYGSSTSGVETTKQELSKLVSMVKTGRPSSPISDLTETEGSYNKDRERKTLTANGWYSLDSSLTSSENSDRMESNQERHVELSLMESNSEQERSGSTISDGNCVEQKSAKRREIGIFEAIDLNLGPKAIDLNSMELEQFNGQY